ncbi:GntR family transcriptional regulator [Desulfosarcina widdelii]|nr:GntR family transcriptional regulator [Desulfosarcina widdelii]
MCIKKCLTRRIAEGTIDHQVPSENQLARQYRVSRMTARKALDKLLHEGRVERIPGKGTFVKKRQLNPTYFHVHAFSEHARRLGVQTHSQVIRSGIETLPAALAEKLPGRQAVCLERVHWLDEQPVCCEIRYLRADWCAPLLDEDLENESVHHLIAGKLNLPITRVWQRLEAVGLPAAVAVHLNIDAGTPAFCMKQVLYSDDEPVSYVDYFLRSDVYAFEDRFEPGKLSTAGWGGDGSLSLDRPDR